MAKKTQEFNRTEGADLWATWKVLTGPRTGQYARLFGVSSWADLDKTDTTNTINIPRSNEESSYWREKITPLQKTKMAPMEVWMNVPGTAIQQFGGRCTNPLWSNSKVEDEARNVSEKNGPRN